MKTFKFLAVILLFSFVALQTYAQLLPPDPGGGGGGGGAVPLDGGILLALLAAGGVGASLFAKSKKKEK